jgi:hypothetical protein
MTIYILANVNVLVPDIFPFRALLVVEAVVVVKLWGISGIFGNFHVPIARSAVLGEFWQGGQKEKE